MRYEGNKIYFERSFVRFCIYWLVPYLLGSLPLYDTSKNKYLYIYEGIKIALSREFGAKNNLSANRDSGKSKIFTGEAFPHQSAHRDA